jgi:hypothetical protein
MNLCEILGSPLPQNRGSASDNRPPNHADKPTPVNPNPMLTNARTTRYQNAIIGKIIQSTLRQDYQTSMI